MIKNDKRNWVKNPTKREVILVSIAWFAAAFLIILSVTNFFTESIFNKKYAMLYFLLIASIITVIKVFSNYFRNQKIKRFNSDLLNQ